MERKEDIIGNLFDNFKENICKIFDFAKDNPEIILAKAQEIISEKEKEIEKLKLQEKNLQAKINYLEGQISVYKNFMNSKFEE